MHPALGTTKSSITTSIDDENASLRLDRALAGLVPSLSRERLKSLIASGCVTRGETAITDPAAKTAAGETFVIHIPAPAPSDNAAQAIDLVIAYEDDELIVIDKPAGLVVHPAAGNLDGTLVNALLHHCAGRLSGIGGVARPGIVHRIDKDTSGLMVAAKTDRAHEGLSAQFVDHSIDRRYKAIVAGLPGKAEGTIDAALARSPYDRKKIAIVEARDFERGRGKRAITHWRLLKALRHAALIECRLETGRTHQIRVHMTSIGHPLLGDPVYGRTAPEHRATLARLGFARQALHAARLGFLHPVSNRNLIFESDIPAEMQELFTALTV